MREHNACNVRKYHPLAAININIKQYMKICYNCQVYHNKPKQKLKEKRQLQKKLSDDCNKTNRSVEH